MATEVLYQTTANTVRNKVNREITSEDDKEVKHIGTDLTYTHKVIWSSVVVYFSLHVCAIVGLGRCVLGIVPMSTLIWSFFYLVLGIEGTYIGAHRKFSHKSFKSKDPLKMFILLMQVTSGQHSAYIWARDHRQHHRYSDTDGDPHNAKRGLFYSHIGWLMTKRHPLCKELRKSIDTSDLQQDKLVMWQYKYYQPLYFIFGFLLPVCVPMYFFNDSLANAFFVSYALRYVLCLNNTFLVNSMAHKYGMRPYDKNLQPVENRFISTMTFGEGWHNYHHAFPWDYKAAEHSFTFHLSTWLIDFFESIGLAYDLKTVSPDMLHNRIKRSGDGTHQVDDLTDLVTAYGPLHHMNPTYTVRYPDPDTSRLWKLRK